MICNGSSFSNKKKPVLTPSAEDMVTILPECAVENYIAHSETAPLLYGKTVKTGPVLTRFWILFLFSFLGWLWCVEWNTFGPINESVEAAFPGWNSGTIALIADWATIMFVVFFLPFCWVAQRSGLRPALLVASGLMAFGLTLRCLSLHNIVFTRMSYICAICLGIASSLVLSAPPMIAAEWFPPNERITACAIMMGSAQLGSLGSFLESLVVRVPGPGVSVLEIRKDIMKLMYAGAILGGIIFIAALIYFPSKPRMAPSLTSTKKRLHFKEALCHLIHNSDFWLLIIAYGSASGGPYAILTTLNYSLQPLGFHQDESMYVGISAVVLSAISGMISGKITDHIYGNLKVTICILCLAAAGFFYWFLFLTFSEQIPPKWQVYASLVGGISIHFAAVPLFFELAAELSYPVPEVLVGGIVTAADSLGTTVFLSIYLIPGVGYKWIPCALVAETGLMSLLLINVKENYSRSHLDRPDM